MITSKKFIGLCLATFLVAFVGFTAWAASGPEEILNQIIQKYMEQRFGESMKYIAAADPKVDKVKVDLKKGVLTSRADGSFKLLGKRYKATYGQTWKDKNNCAYIADIEFETEMNATVSDVARKAMKALYAKKCEPDERLNAAIKAAWLVKGLTP